MNPSPEVYRLSNKLLRVTFVLFISYIILEGVMK